MGAPCSRLGKNNQIILKALFGALLNFSGYANEKGGFLLAIRTDLATELRDLKGEHQGIAHEELSFGEIKIERTHIINNEGAKHLGKPLGHYVTLSFGGFTPDDIEGDLHTAIKNELSELLGEKDSILLAGLGNKRITPDAFGPLAAEGIFATRHIEKTLATELGLGDLKCVEVITPGVLGQTGIEAAELIKAAADATRPEAVIVLDALAAGALERVGTTVQLSDSGICPGSGVGNARKEISEATLGIPVIAIGIPTVVDASSLSQNKSTEKMMVTPRDIDSMIKYSAKAVSHAINCALQPNLAKSTLLSLGF